MSGHTGLDLGSKMGWCHGEAQTVPLCGTVPLPSYSDGWGAMLAALTDWLWKYYDQFRPTEIWYEDILPTSAMAGHTNDITQRTLITQAAQVELFCYRASIPAYPVHMSKARSFVIPRRGKIAKDQVKGLVMSEMYARGLKPDSDNAADAGAIWAYAEHQILRRLPLAV